MFDIHSECLLFQGKNKAGTVILAAWQEALESAVAAKSKEASWTLFKGQMQSFCSN